MDGTVERRERSGKDLAGGRDETTWEISIPDYAMRDYEALEKASAGASAMAEGRETRPTGSFSARGTARCRPRG
jgi:hypothetical protein